MSLRMVSPAPARRVFNGFKIHYGRDGRSQYGIQMAWKLNFGYTRGRHLSKLCFNPARPHHRGGSKTATSGGFSINQTRRAAKKRAGRTKWATTNGNDLFGARGANRARAGISISRPGASAGGIPRQGFVAKLPRQQWQVVTAPVARRREGLAGCCKTRRIPVTQVRERVRAAEPVYVVSPNHACETDGCSRSK